MARAIAIIMVTLNHNFRSNNTEFVHDLFVVFGKAGVPLFLLITGYLNCHKTLYDYYKDKKWTRCLDILIAYILLGSICHWGLCYYRGNSFSMQIYFHDLLSFQLTKNGWFVEMWIGLFFITPFLNMIVANCAKMGKKCFLCTIITVVCMTSIPAFVNRDGMTLMPGYWTKVWPIALYLVGAWLRHYQLRFNNMSLLFVCFVIIIGEPLLNYIIKPGKFMYFWGGHDDIIYMALAISVFLLCMKSPLNIGTNLIVRKLASLSLYIYLIGYLFDTLMNDWFVKCHDFKNPIKYIPYNAIAFLCSITLSFLTALIYHFIYKNIISLVSRYNSILCDKRNENLPTGS